MQENPESATGVATATGNATASATAAAAAPRTDRLELVKELPRGSVGVVHQARNPQQNRSVALRKFEVPEWLEDAADLLKKILTEAKSASALDHPNIARLYTCGYKDFTVFMTAEFIEGQNLKEMMAKRQPEMAEALQLSKQLLTALDYAHSKGVFHNFLNPYNIKVLPDGTLKLLDFGIVRDKNLLTQSPTKKLENEPYLSPEQVKNKPSDKASNIFNAAAIIYQLYTARSPFAGPHLGEVDRSITDVNPHPMQMAHPRVPEQISSCGAEGAGEESGGAVHERPAVLCRLGRSCQTSAGGESEFYGIDARLPGRAGRGQRYRSKACVPGRSGTERKPVIQRDVAECEPVIQSDAITEREPGNQDACCGNHACCRAADCVASAGEHSKPLEAGRRRCRRALPDCWPGIAFPASAGIASVRRWKRADITVGCEHARAVQASARPVTGRPGEDAFAGRAVALEQDSQELCACGSCSSARAE